jgi:hypothetical protein
MGRFSNSVGGRKLLMEDKEGLHVARVTLGE